MDATRNLTLAVIGLLVLAGGLLATPAAVEAGPSPCPPPDANVFFYDCFDLFGSGLLDTDGSDDTDLNPVVDSNNEAAWAEDQINDRCRISAEELHLLTEGTAGVCNSVTSPTVNVSGYNEVTISFEWGGVGPAAADILLSQDGGAFAALGNISIAAGGSCVGGVNCATTTFTSMPVVLTDCGDHTLQLQITGPTAGEETTIAVIDDVRIAGTAQECEGDGEDDPEVPNISVTKVCVGEGFDATFEISIGELAETVACDGTTTLVDADPATYAISEEITGTDADAFTTVIVCSDGSVTEGTSASVTIPEEGAADVTCVVINAFEAGVADLFCSCTCCLGDIEIDIGNSNNNTIGIDNANTNTNANDNNNENDNENKNENENNNTNTNTQNHENTQDQDNANEQTNNITSSPEVNIDFD